VQHSSQPSRIDQSGALAILSGGAPLYDILAEAARARDEFFGRAVRIHILGNIKNGNCAEDCGYCAQRRDGASGIRDYALRSADDIFAEAKAAKENGAYRYCMVTAGTGPSTSTTRELSQTIRRISTELGMKVCLSAGFVDDDKAQLLADAGLDRYNHNLNTSAMHYPQICNTHTYTDRVDTLQALTRAGVGLCSGVIVGMGESAEDFIETAFALKELRVISIPVNFFIPVPGHAIRQPQKLTPEYCLRTLIVMRLVNPDSEIRIGAGREGHLRSLQATALMVANSLFASGYLNVKGSNMQETLDLIADAAMTAELENGSVAQSQPLAYAPENFPQLLKHVV